MVSSSAPTSSLPWWLPATIGLGCVLGLVGLAAYGVGKSVSGIDLAATLTDPTLARIARFTVLEAGLSAIISVAIALPFARAASRRPHWRGLQIFMRFASLAFVTPVIIGVFGVVEVHGVTGWLNQLAAAITGDDFGPYVYGLGGILIAHAFFNVPFAARNFDRALAGIPPESWRLASQLGMTSGQIFRLIEWPALARVFLPTAALIFAMCFTSFAVVVTLGGGPGANILEVAIYQALRFDFDISRAVGLTLAQITLAALFIGPLLFFARAPAEQASTGQSAMRPDANSRLSKFSDISAFTAALFVIGLPMVGILLPGLLAFTSERLSNPDLWRAAGWSLTIATAAGCLAFVIGMGVLVTQRHLAVRMRRPNAAKGLEAIGAIILVTPPMMLGSGLFLALRDNVDLFSAAAFLVIAVNTLVGLPFILRLIGPDFLRVAERHDRLSASLGITGFNRWRMVDWPSIRPAAATALAVVMTLTAGDLGVIALFGTPETTTLPLLIFQQMGAYRMNDAAVGVVVLVTLCLAIFVTVDQGLARTIPKKFRASR